MMNEDGWKLWVHWWDIVNAMWGGRMWLYSLSASLAHGSCTYSKELRATAQNHFAVGVARSDSRTIYAGEPPRPPSTRTDQYNTEKRAVNMSAARSCDSLS